MIELKGIYNTAKLFSDTAEAVTVSQIENLLNQEFVAGSKIRVMPDAHAGMGCTIGTTMTVIDKVVPNLVGVDIGCGMETAVLDDESIELKRLDDAIHAHIPAGFAIRKSPHEFLSQINLRDLRCFDKMNIKRANLSIGTLGGGNHFIELGRDEDGRLYLVVHSGSRNLGNQCCQHYQKMAADKLGKGAKAPEKQLAYLEGAEMADYLHDMTLIQRYADINRRAIIAELAERLKLRISDQFTTIHNYIDTADMILRKGAISAKAGERVLIPMNMRDGSLVCIGRGNPDWNFSAPHGAGRLMSRTAAKAAINLADFRASMEGIYSSTVNKSTIDEAPHAYKPMDEIIRNMGDSVNIIKTVKPLFNFKAAE